ncbi:zinc ABC transporter substrate-binding protein [Tropicimonas sp. IMCC6043]|uniref:zinc ABC transporter substrate-binding protein n=1 Tax=Tropicimonas sp. IMCC6043 TaxID=2510645 RepID=UPI00101C0FE0|nr:zinc ABC transporter substrate-binding protein [Tropicimonas sp. IMCC6043]RYH09497.1 zinc transporter [Tropicimonas sp. IMCC6043]
MKTPSPTALVAAIAFCGTAGAEVPRVAVDVAPVQSLVAQVMGDLGVPDLVLPPGASPHGYALRPSEARALAEADLVFWVGEELTPWLGDTLDTLAGEARRIALLDTPGTLRLAFRNEAVFEIFEADSEEGDFHDHADEDDHDHAHEGVDPHAWLAPENAANWIGVIAAALMEADPENATLYAANAVTARARIGELADTLTVQLEPLVGLRFVVFHDAFQYFETSVGLPALGAISLGDASGPGAARVGHLRDLVQNEGVTCIAAEPQFNPALVETIAGGAEIRTTVLDPLGANLESGPDFYASLLEGLADGLLACR